MTPKREEEISGLLSGILCLDLSKWFSAVVDLFAALHRERAKLTAAEKDEKRHLGLFEEAKGEIAELIQRVIKVETDLDEARRERDEAKTELNRLKFHKFCGVCMGKILEEQEVFCCEKCQKAMMECVKEVKRWGLTESEKEALAETRKVLPERIFKNAELRARLSRLEEAARKALEKLEQFHEWVDNGKASMKYSWDAAEVLRSALTDQEPNPDADIAAGRVTRFKDTETFLKSLEPKPVKCERCITLARALRECMELLFMIEGSPLDLAAKYGPDFEQPSLEYIKEIFKEYSEMTNEVLAKQEPKPDGKEGEPLIPTCRCGRNYVEELGHLVCPNCREFFVEPKEGEEGEEAH
jgi:predicted nucleic acid-binding Zn ribbon protein